MYEKRKYNILLTAVLLLYPLSMLAAMPALQDRLNESIRIFSNKALNLNEAQMAQDAIEAMIKAIDPKGAVVTSTELQDMLDQRSGYNYASGIKLCFTGETITVSQVLPESPAATTDIQINDQLLEVNNQKIDGLSPPEILSLLRANEPKLLAMQLARGTNIIQTEINLQKIQLPTIEALEYFPEDIVYVRANGMFDHSGDELLTILQEQRKNNKFGVILDLRGAVGLNIDAVNQIANALAVPATKLYSFQSKDNTTLTEVISDDTPRLAVPLMILIDENTGGASELFAAICKNALKGCMILGSEASGTPMLREAIPFTDDQKLYFATKKLTTGKANTVFDGSKGLIPDIAVSNEWYAQIYEPDDTETTLAEELEDRKLRERIRGDGPLSRATDLLLGLKALNISPREKQTSN